MKLFFTIFLFLKANDFLNAQVKIYDAVKSTRTIFAVQKLQSVLKKYKLENKNYAIFLLKKNKLQLQKSILKKDTIREGFNIVSNEKNVSITGADETGVLYGCLEFIEQIKKTKTFPKNLNISDAPEMVLRGQCIGLQKSSYLPGRNVYEYPITKETFPWFYNKQLWLQVLDSMLNIRMNSLYLWNGHPFASLVKLPEYPYAVEVDDATFKMNEDIYKFITTEADKRGIWVIQMFYNIIVSKPFAEFHKIKTQERERHITPLLADYTQKSIAAFVAKYPNVGLMVCLGEAMEGVGQDDINWFTKTIIPGVKDGLKQIGKEGTEPPIVLRAHDTDAPTVMEAALPLYKNLYTEAKFNGEALTYATPRGDWKKLHNKLASLGSTHIANVHILANLEPFRYGSPKFIQECVIGMVDTLKANALHLYPQASYWDWPYTADSIQGVKRLLQIERDWIWYKAWARYAWKANRNNKDETSYWATVLANQYGCSYNNGLKILKAYNESGEVAPKLLRRFGITDGNRQTLTLGMLMTQLINPYRYGLFTLLYDAEAPEGESILENADKEFKKEKHIGETPIEVIKETVISAELAFFQLQKIEKSITKNKEEFYRLKNDMLSYTLLANHFYHKVNAALYTLKYKYSNQLLYLDTAKMHLHKSVLKYKKLSEITEASYLYANSMQTQQRKIPMRGFNGAYKHWKEMLPVFEKELTIFQNKIDSLKNFSNKALDNQIVILKNADVKLEDTYTYNQFEVKKRVELFNDSTYKIVDLAPELNGLKGYEIAKQIQLKEGTVLNFNTLKPVKILVGFFKPIKAAFTSDTTYVKEPELETNASADDYGQAEIKIANAIAIRGMPPINIHTYSFKAGNNTLKIGKGICLIIGFISYDQKVPIYDAQLLSNKKDKNIDWLFE